MGPETALEQRLKALEDEVGELRKQLAEKTPSNQVSLILFSGEWDRLFAGLTIASGALAMGHEVHLFFTFWAVSALRCKGKACSEGKEFSQSMIGSMLPEGLSGAKLSKMHFMGLGKMMMRRLMKKHGVEDLDSLMKDVRDLGAHFHLCETSSGLFGLKAEELEQGDAIDRCGVATFLGHAFKSRIVLFI
jgi:peroxiredoxin family protein